MEWPRMPREARRTTVAQAPYVRHLRSSGGGRRGDRHYFRFAAVFLAALGFVEVFLASALEPPFFADVRAAVFLLGFAVLARPVFDFSRALAPATPPMTAPVAAPSGPSIDPTAAPAAAPAAAPLAVPPTVPRPVDVAPAFTSFFLVLAIARPLDRDLIRVGIAAHGTPLTLIPHQANDVPPSFTFPPPPLNPCSQLGLAAPSRHRDVCYLRNLGRFLGHNV